MKKSTRTLPGNENILNGRILNIGCGDKFEIGSDFVDLYPARKDVLKCDMNTDPLPYPDGTFDVVYTASLIEHLHEPSHLFTEAYRVLKKGGKFVLRTDNPSYIFLHLPLGSMYDGNYSSTHGDDDRHYMLFTRSHLLTWAEKFGFRNAHVTYSHFFGYNDTSLRKFAKAIIHKVLPARFSALHLVLEAEK